ncbi:chain-length determining protein [Chitinilyticum piscinae]|uniref:chain-length determining protein n=1 Tax=Chitinilyticum piscinae TaxID=2866724 RepID=UPI001D1608C8|nr:chain-length determining protein [Chitinilyticum piscinae]
MNWAQGWLLPAIMRRRVFRTAFYISLAACIYWGFIASDRYVSTSHVLIQRTDLMASQAMDFGALLAGGGSNNRGDQLLLREHLLSLDMLKKLDARLKLREHFSDIRRDPLSRMWSKDEELEYFHNYFLKRVSVEFDDYSGVLIIRAEAFEPKMAQAIVQAMVEDGEQFMNQLGHRLASEQVIFLEKQVVNLNERVMLTSRKLLAYQNKTGMVAPKEEAEHMAGVINALETQRVELSTKRAGMLAYLSPDSPDIANLNIQLDALDKQITAERLRLASPDGKPLNASVLDYKILEGEAKLAEEVYKTALVALEKGRLEATRNLKKVSILQSANLPEYPLEPRRLFNILTFVLVTLIIAGIVQLLVAVIRDHKD